MVQRVVFCNDEWAAIRLSLSTYVQRLYSNFTPVNMTLYGGCQNHYKGAESP